MSRTVRCLAPVLMSAALLSIPGAASADPPICDPLELTVAPGERVELPDACSDPDDDAITLATPVQPTRGTLDATPAYTADAGEYGVDAFTYRATDADGEVSEETPVSVLVNTEPRCSDLTLTTPRNTPLVLPTPPCADDPRAIRPPAFVADEPDLGALDLPEDGTQATYQPPRGFTGTDAFVFYAEDEWGFTSDDATLTVEVTAHRRSRIAPAPSSDRTGPVVTLRSGAHRLGRVRRAGLKLTIGTDERARLALVATVGRAGARRLGLGRRPARVGHLRLSAGAGEHTVMLPLTRRARRALAGVRRVTLRARVRATDAAGNATTRSLAVTLRR